MKFSDIKKNSKTDLVKSLYERKKDLFMLRLSSLNNESKISVSKIKEARKDIAKILTALSQLNSSK